MSYMTSGDATREQDARRVREAQEQAAAVERARLDRVRRWGEALSALPAEELQRIAQRWNSYTEAIVPAAQAALDIQRESPAKKGRK